MWKGIVIGLLPAALAAQSTGVAKVVVTPASPVATVGQPLQLKAQALDSAGRVVPNAVIRFQRSMGIFEGGVDQDGLVTTGAPGFLVVNVTAIVENQRPVIQRVTIPVHAGPAASITIEPLPTKLLAGQSLHMKTTVHSATGDLRADDRPDWSSSAPAVVRVSSDGTLTAAAPGKATITAKTGAARETFAIAVVSGNVRSLSIEPSSSNVRTGDVIHFILSATDASGHAISGLTPTWMFAPGKGSSLKTVPLSPTPPVHTRSARRLASTSRPPPPP